MGDNGPEDRAEELRRAIALRRASGATTAGRAVLPARPSDAPPLLGELQRSLWLLHKLEPDSAAYTLASAYRSDVPLDRTRLQAALDHVVERHQLLRSTFEVRDGRVQQIVHAFEPIGIDFGQADDPIEAATREARRSFDLEAGPLLRMHLLEGPGDQCLLLLALHHIVADEQSLRVFWRQFIAAYEGRPAEEVPAQYDDFVHWQRQRDPEARERDFEFWRHRLDPLPEDLFLPFEKPGGSDDPLSTTGQLLRLPLNADSARRVAELASRTGTTPFVVYAFAFRLLLGRYAYGQRIAFATPATTRSHPATKDMIGYFLNPLVVPSQIDERLPVDAALRLFAKELRELLSHAGMPFTTLTERLAPPRQTDRHPLFQVMFVHQRLGDELSIGGIELRRVELDLGDSKFDLTLFVSEGEGVPELGVEYNARRFDEPMMRRLLHHYAVLLDGILERRSGPCSHVSQLDAKEEAWLRQCERGPTLEEPSGSSLPQRILLEADRRPSGLALVCGDEAWSHRRMADSAGHIAQALRDRGLTSEDRVGLFVDRSPWMISGIVGSLWAGVPYVPLDASYPGGRIAEVLDDADVSAVLTTTGVESRLPEGPWSTVCMDRLAPVTSGRTAPGPVDSETTAYIMYTSGSTGRPKGVVITHENLTASTDARVQAYGDPPGRFLLLPSVAFDSSVAGIFWTLTTGGTLILPTDEEARDPRAIVRLIHRHGVSSTLCVPSLYAQLLRLGGPEMGRLRTAIVAGERCQSSLVEEHFRTLPAVRLYNEYGPTEATVWATVHEVSREDTRRPVPIGRPIPGVRIEVRDRAGRRVPARVPGEALVLGLTVASGYWKRDALTEERFGSESGDDARGRMYRTGDRVSWTSAGQLEFLGREDDQIKLRGFRIEPGEIEAALVEQPGIREAAVVVRSTSPHGPRPSPAGPTTRGDSADDRRQLVAFVLSDGPLAGGLQGALADRLPDHMVPRRYEALGEFPRLPNGKVDRARLESFPLSAPGRGDSPSAPEDDRERTLVALWEGLLSVEGISPTDNFFELGGHSLLVVEMTIAIERDLGVALSATEVFQHPTIRELARRIADQQPPDFEEYAHLFPLQPSGHGNPFIVAVPHVFSGVFAHRFRGERPVYGLRGVSLRSEGNRGRWPTMTDLAEELVGEIRTRFPERSVLIAGYSFGASMAFEAARLMEEAGVTVEALYLISPMPIDTYDVGPFRFRVPELHRPVADLGKWEAIERTLRYYNPLQRGLYQQLKQVAGVRPWRRLLCGWGDLRRRLGRPLTPQIMHADVRLERFRMHAAFRPQPTRVPAVIFNSEETGDDAAATWRPYFQGPLEIVPTPDPHRGEPFLGDAKAVILRHLAQLDAPREEPLDEGRFRDA